MDRPEKRVAGWLARPQVTNRDALVVGVLGGLLTTGMLYGAGTLLEVADVVDFEGSLPVWLGAIVAAVSLALGLLGGAWKGAKADELHSRISGLEARTAILGAYEVYTEHVRDALADLRRLIAGELPAFSLRDYIEDGLFEPAQRLLGRVAQRGEIRLSVLHVEGNEFVMGKDDELFPALGHTLEGRQKFRITIDESFSGHAYRRKQVLASGKLSADERFHPHPKASRPYESIVSVPLCSKGEVDGVFNVVATGDHAFTAVERTYIALLGSVIDVARAAAATFDEHGDSNVSVPPDDPTN